MATRSYHDPCGIARALDLLGDRWALLLVRELIYSPKRFSHLREGLPGASQSVLTQRLRDLEAANLVRRVSLGRPGDVPAYELTERGAAVKPILIAMGTWGSRSAQTSATPMSASALVLALETCFDRTSLISGSFSLELAGELFHLRARDQILEARGGRSGAVDATIVSDVETLRSIAFRRQSLEVSETNAKLAILGDRNAVLALCNSFLVPQPWQ